MAEGVFLSPKAELDLVQRLPKQLLPSCSLEPKAEGSAPKNKKPQNQNATDFEVFLNQP